MAIKRSFDCLPSGICFFNKSGLPILCNQKMHEIVFAMTGRDLQMITDLTDTLEKIEKIKGFQKDGNAIIFPDESVWQFQAHNLSLDEEYIKYIATDITEIYHKKKDLETLTSEQEEMVEGLKEIVQNVTAITREEEILAMKMNVHSKIGWFLQRLRRYREERNHYINKGEIAQDLREVADILHGEIGHNDEVDSLYELCKVAKSLGVTVKITGEPSKNVFCQNLINEVIRECVTNTIRHAGGDCVFVTISNDNKVITAEITNNGKQPKSQITEGGGLSSIRRQVEKAKGTMNIVSCPNFNLKVIIPNQDYTEVK